MKNLTYLFLFIITASFAQNDFERGNEYYQQGKYKQAISAYENILKKNQHAAELYFNLGNCYYKLNQIAPSIYNYEKALILDPNDVESCNNLKIAQKMIVDEIKEVPKIGLHKLLHDITSIYHYNTWAWISVWFSFMFLAFFVGYYFSIATRLKRIFFFGMFLWILLLALSIGSAIFEKRNVENEKPAIVFAEIVEIKSEPQTSSPPSFVLHEGTKVYIKDVVGKWKKIQLADGTEGWIEAKTIREIK